ncbi:unnamed protein product [Lupinus luteus]|uniref:Uncharacterized protein n=1 Tax=Lupinus luteus TaxID=3873 RepID=A0AAV1XMD5_LUPLU
MRESVLQCFCFQMCNVCLCWFKIPISFMNLRNFADNLPGRDLGFLHWVDDASRCKRATSLADSSPASLLLPFRVEPRPKSGIRQQDLLKKVVEIKPKRPRTDDNQSTPVSSSVPVITSKPKQDHLKEKEQSLLGPKKVEEQSLSSSKKVEEHPSSAAQETEAKPKIENTGVGLLGLAYTSSDDEE